MHGNKNVLNLKDFTKEDIDLAGNLACEYGEMINARIPLARGFVISNNAYKEFVSLNNLRLKIKHLLETVNFKHFDSLSQASAHIQKIILTSQIPEQIIKDVLSAYKNLGGLITQPGVKVCLSTEKETSGFFTVKGDANLLLKIKELWASIYSKTALTKRFEENLKEPMVISVIIQKQISPDASGTLFTIDPLTRNKNRMIIQAYLGNKTPDKKTSIDRYEVDKKDLTVIIKTIGTQTLMFKQKTVKVPRQKISAQKLTAQQIKMLTNAGGQIEKLYYFPKQIDWSIEQDVIYIEKVTEISFLPVSILKEHYVFISALPICTGMVSGTVKIILKPSDIQEIKLSDIAIIKNADLSFLPLLKKAGGIIIEQMPGKAFTATARGRGIPTVAGAKDAIKLLKSESVITLNATKGEVLKGGYFTQNIQRLSPSLSETKLIKTATKIYINLESLNPLDKPVDKSVEAVFFDPSILFSNFKIHPRKLLKENYRQQFGKELVDSLTKVCKSFYPKTVIYKFIDLKSNDFRKLIGGNDFEPFEDNPVLGFHGALRYVYDHDFFKLQTNAIKQVRTLKAQKNLSLMFPFVRNVKELKYLKEMLSAECLKLSENFKLWIEIATPGACLNIEQFLKEKPSGILIDGLTINMLLLGLDSEKVETVMDNQALSFILNKTLRSCDQNNIKTCLNTYSCIYDVDRLNTFIACGLTGVSSSYFMLNNLKETVSKAEKKLIS